MSYRTSPALWQLSTSNLLIAVLLLLLLQNMPLSYSIDILKVLMVFFPFPGGGSEYGQGDGMAVPLSKQAACVDDHQGAIRLQSVKNTSCL